MRRWRDFPDRPTGATGDNQWPKQDGPEPFWMPDSYGHGGNAADYDDAEVIV
jgi:hypothetical protein